MALPPQSAHTSADVDARPLVRSTGRGARHRQRPRSQFKQPEQTIWNETRPRGIDVAITSRGQRVPPCIKVNF
jgi:hypothetical protein